MATLNSTKINGRLDVSSNSYFNDGINTTQLNTTGNAYFNDYISITPDSTNPYIKIRGASDSIGFLIQEHNLQMGLGSTWDKSIQIDASGETLINNKLTIMAKNNIPLEIFSGGGNSNYAEGIRLHPYDSNSDSSIVFCGSDNTGSTGTSSKSWCIYNHDGAFHIRHNTSDAIIIDGGSSINLYRGVVFANNTWNLVGDDCYMGDHNYAGGFCLKGATGTTTLVMYKQGSDTDYGKITYDGSMLKVYGCAEYPSIYGGNIAHSYWPGAFPNSSSGFTQMFGYALSHGSVNGGKDTGDIVFTLKPVGSSTAELNIGIDGNYWQRAGQPVVSVASYSNGVLSLQAGY